MKTLVILIVCCVYTYSMLALPDSIQVNDKIDEVLESNIRSDYHRLLELISEGGTRPNNTSKDTWLSINKERAKEYYEVIGRLGRKLDEQAIGKVESVNNKSVHLSLMKLSQSASDARDKILEIKEYYRFPEKAGRDDPKRPRIPNLNPQHTVEAYRVAWEAMLLEPPTMETSAFYNSARSTPMQALVKIGNEKSIPLFEIAFALTCDGEVYDQFYEHRQFRLIEALSTFRTKNSLDVLISCMRIKKASPNGLKGEMKGAPFDQWVVYLLTQVASDRERVQWLAIVSQYDDSELEPEIKIILKNIEDKLK